MKRTLLVFVVALAAVSVFAVAAQAKPISPNSPLLPFGQVLHPPPSCDSLFNSYMGDVGGAVDSMAAGDTASASNYINAANDVMGRAKGAGCSWAFTVTPPALTSPVGPSTP